MPNEKTMPKMKEQEIEDAIEVVLCPKLRDVLKWIGIMKMTGNTATDYEHFRWCVREIVSLRQQVKVLEVIAGGVSDA